jgi:hypothetical protein
MPEANISQMILDLLAAFKLQNSEAHERIFALIEKQNGRIGALERWRAYVVGIAVGVGGIAGGIVAAIAKALTTGGS